MDHSENDKRFCVYVHKDKDGNVRYIGSGSIRRYNRISGRTKEHKEIFDTLTKEIIKSGLSKNESLEMEMELYDKYVSSGILLNKKRPTKVTAIDFEELSNFVYYDETSPSFLRWKVDVYTGTNKATIRIKKDSIAGSKSGNGYYLVSINKTKYLVHRVIYSLQNKHNLQTNLVIDHIDNNRTNNAIWNLRAVTASDNSKNRQDIKEKGDMSGINILKDGVVSFRYTDINTRFSKDFSPSVLYPNIDKDVATAKCILLAKQYRDILLSGGNTSDINGFISEMLTKFFSAHSSKCNIKKNMSEDTLNIVFEERNGVNSCRWRVIWKEDKKKLSKSFSCYKLFPDLDKDIAITQTFELAKEFRDSKLKELKGNAA